MDQDILYDYNDTYTCSIQNLLERYEPKTLIHLKKILDENGYIGRHLCTNRVVYGFSMKDIVISIELPHSQYKYRFYPKYDYELYSSIIKSRTVKKFKKDRRMLEALCVFVKRHCALPYTLMNDTNWKLEDCEMIIDNLHRIGLIKDNVCVITDERDINEVYDNIIQQI